MVLQAPILENLIATPDASKIAVTLVLIAPFACFMGMPFPLSITQLARGNPELVPWAWGVNGCASVVAVVLATLLAIHFGFRVVVAIVVTLYLTTLVTQGRDAAGSRQV